MRAAKDFARKFGALLHGSARVFAAMAILLLAVPAGSQAATLDQLNDLLERAQVALDEGRYKEARELAEVHLKLVGETFGTSHVNYGNALVTLASSDIAEGKYAEAEKLLLEGVDVLMRASGTRSLDVATALNNLAIAIGDQGRHGEAATFYEKCLQIRERVLGRNHPEVGVVLQNLANEYKDMDRVDDAVQLYQRSLAIREKALGQNHPDVARVLNNLANLFNDQDRLAEAEAMHRRALAIREKSYRPGHPAIAESLNNLGNLYVSMDRAAEAEPLLRRSLEINSETLGPSHPAIGLANNNLAMVYEKLGRKDEAETLYKTGLAIREAALGPTHLDVADSLNNLATFYESAGKPGEAEKLLKRSYDIRRAVLGPDHSSVAMALRNLGLMELHRQQPTAALDYFRQATSIRARMEAAAAGQRSELRAEGHTERFAFGNLIEAAWQVAGADRAQIPALAREAFLSVQSAERQLAGAALSQMAARFGVGDAALAHAIRDHQDLLEKAGSLDAKLVAAVGGQAGERDEKAIASLRAAIDDNRARLAASTRKLQADFPEYAELSAAAPISVEDVQRLLAPDEALVVLLSTRYDPDAFVWAVTHHDVAWKKLEFGGSKLIAKIRALRKPLDDWAKSPRGLQRLTTDSETCVAAGAEPDARGLVRPATAAGGSCASDDEFSLARAHELYAALLGPVADTIRSKPRLIVVASGPLTGLPFNVLVTEAPPADSRTVAAFKSAKWLVQSHSIAVLPAVSSLRALRSGAHQSAAAKPFVGFGDPEFQASQKSKRRRDRGTASPTVAEVGAVTNYFRGSAADGDALRAGLPALPDSAGELKAIAETLAASEGDVVLGRNASESTVKAMSADGRLAGYKVVAFATHGLVAGELKDLAEPAIALSVPVRPSDIDDGLLTASEAAGLKLDADWVVLSACNTAAGGAADAQALSGLARAFFYAGSRAMLVSHWPVDSAAAVKLTTGTFAALRNEPGLGRAGAFRQAMLQLIDKGEAYEAHPAYWAPFFVVGAD